MYRYLSVILYKKNVNFMLDRRQIDSKIATRTKYNYLTILI